VQPRRLVELVVDGVLVSGTFLAVYLLVVGGRGTELQRGTFLAVLPIVLGATYVVYVLVGVYRRAWRYATTRDLGSVALASAIATIAAYLIVLATRDLGDFPREVFVVYGLAAAALAVLSRWLVRLVPEAGAGPDDGRRRVLVAGAGRVGRGLVRDLSRLDDVRVVGFLDDNPRLRRRRVQGVPVLGSIGDVAEALETTRADELVVTIPEASSGRLEQLERACDAAGISHRLLRDPLLPTTPTRALAE
jgi:FlaA1/EpsC-like NDP-sugar epimerase